MKPDLSKATPRPCGCRLEPCEDSDLRVDLCSEAINAFDGKGWFIVRCPLHDGHINDAARELAELVGKAAIDLRDWADQQGQYQWTPAGGLKLARQLEDKAREFLRLAGFTS